jgi:hypothetical protein
MGVPYNGTDMTEHPQYIVVRNKAGAKMLNAVRKRLITQPTVSTGNRRPLVMQACEVSWAWHKVSVLFTVEVLLGLAQTETFVLLYNMMRKRGNGSFLLPIDSCQQFKWMQQCWNANSAANPSRLQRFTRCFCLM